MERLRFENVCPAVFEQRTDLSSQIWKQQITFEKGKLCLLEAESGQGKSTFCSYLLGYRRDYSGKILFDDTDAQTLSKRAWTTIRQSHISLLFQELRLFPELTAWENVEIKNKLTSFKHSKEIELWFERLGIADKKDVKVGMMSFGQQQRVAFMRSLVQPFDFLLVDEPISHLDERNAAILGEMMMEEVRRQGAGVIVTSIGKHMALPYEQIFRL